MSEPVSKKYRSEKTKRAKRGATYTPVTGTRLRRGHYGSFVPNTTNAAIATVNAAMEAKAMKAAGFVDYLIDAGSAPSVALIPFNNVDVAAGANIPFFATVPQNSGINGRVGARIKWKSIQIRGWIRGGPALVAEMCSIIFVYDRDPRGAIPKPSDILSVASPLGLLNNAERMRFLIVKRFDFKVIGTSGSVSERGDYFVDEYIKCRGLKATYSGVGTGDGSIGDIKDGALYALFTGTQGPAASNANFEGYIRTRYADLQG